MDNLSDLYAERIQAWRKATARMSYSAIDPKRNAVALYDALTQAEKGFHKSCLAVAEHVAQLEADKDRLLEQLVAGEELYISRGIEIAQLEEENEELRNAGQESATMLRRFLGFGPSTKLELLLTEQEDE